MFGSIAKWLLHFECWNFLDETFELSNCLMKSCVGNELSWCISGSLCVPIDTGKDVWLSKQISRTAAKSSELQTQLSAAQEDLKKAKEQLIKAEKEKENAINELKEAQKLSEEPNEKLREAMVAQKRAEDGSEIEKFRAVELELKLLRRRKRNGRESLKVCDRIQYDIGYSVNRALSHADDATKIAEIHVEKVEILSAELIRLKGLLDSKLEIEASENKIVSELQTEIESLKQELEKAKDYDEKLAEKATLIEQLNVEFEAAKMAESYAHSMLDERRTKLEGKNELLHDAESEISSLKEKVGMLEMTIGRQRGDLEDSEHCLLEAKEENLEMSKRIESLESEIETVNKEKAQALNKEKISALNVQTLLEEKNKLIIELEISRQEEKKTKKAMDSLASALHEVSAEARDSKEKLLANQAQHEGYESQIEDLNIENSKMDNVNSKEEVNVKREEEAQLKENMKEVEAEVVHLQEAFEEAQAENMKCLPAGGQIESERPSYTHAPARMPPREFATVKKVEELSKSLEEATSRNQNKENGDITDSEKDCDLLPKVVEFSEENGHGGEGVPKEEEQELPEEDEGKKKDDSVELKMWESIKIEKKEFWQEKVAAEAEESFEESKIDGGETNGASVTENIDDGGSSPTKQRVKKKKKKSFAWQILEAC
ncbi:hypothetical protein TSUD_412950 [Trifolium subterraneum]|uniref:WEB family protein n=1 Tax=Trifolium subterraneum TaxID=3900 RepID=A0A2Z6PVS7_TRISU|nr:hypothetical protein TSUD_412950 [Trifolium subterraneum]